MPDMSKAPTDCPSCKGEREWEPMRKDRIPRAVCWNCGLITPCHENGKVKQEANQ
jgi:hypothetical protein